MKIEDEIGFEHKVVVPLEIDKLPLIITVWNTFTVNIIVHQHV